MAMMNGAPHSLHVPPRNRWRRLLGALHFALVTSLSLAVLSVNGQRIIRNRVVPPPRQCSRGNRLPGARPVHPIFDSVPRANRGRRGDGFGVRLARDGIVRAGGGSRPAVELIRPIPPLEWIPLSILGSEG